MRKPSRSSPRTGSVLGDWTLGEKIASGGNGDVWRASKQDHSEVALKVLRQIDQISYERFRAEVTVLSENRDVDGILHVLDYYLPPDEDQGRPWYVMSIATPCSNFLEGKKAIEVVKNFLVLAETIVVLHERNISHRDIKPQNILALNGRLCLSDFGLVKYPGRVSLTPIKRDVGPKFTMAPEMRRSASVADGIPADVFSFAKTLWIALTGIQRGFDGQYNVHSEITLKKHLDQIYTTTLDQMLVECTDNEPARRPNMERVVAKLRGWIGIVEDFGRRNGNEWTELLQLIFPIGIPRSAIWTDVDSILLILNEVGRVSSLNHLFYPDGGGNTITKVVRAGEEGFIAIEALSVFLLKPEKLTFESFGKGPEWNYLRLEAAKIHPTGIDVHHNDYEEYLTELNPGEYGPRELWDYPDEDKALPSDARPVSRYLRGAFVIFSTSSPYNHDPSTYDARHESMGEDRFRDYIYRNAVK